MTSLVVDIVPTPPAMLVTVFGEADLATVTHLRECLSTVPDRDTVVETSGVTLLSAVGLRVVLDLQNRLATVGARLVLAAPSQQVRRVLAVTELETRLPTEPTVAEALDSPAAGTTNAVPGG